MLGNSVKKNSGSFDDDRFTITSHDYFERKQGDFYIDHTRQRVIEKKRLTGIKRLIIATILKIFPHLADHQIIIATKTRVIRNR